MTGGRSRTRSLTVRRIALAVLIGIVAGAGLNAMLGDQGADTPALALLGGAVALVVVLVRARSRARTS